MFNIRIFCLVSTLLIGLLPVMLVADVLINEANSANVRGLVDTDGDAEDWIELFNSGSSSVNLDGYGLSDQFTDPFKWIFPARILLPDDYLIVFASEKDRYGSELHSNFKLKSSGETLRLVDGEGVLLDEMAMEDVTRDVSMGWFGGELMFFDEPTPEAANTTQAYPGITPPPGFDPERGLFSSALSVEIDGGESEIVSWSRDGSIPSSGGMDSHVEVMLSETTSLRARAQRAAYLPSRIVTHSYVIDETVNLPVVCLTMDPPDLWDEVTGIYVVGDSAEANWPYLGANFWEDWEKPADWEFFTPGGGGFHLSGGAMIHGGWSRAQPQKALRLVARDAYGESEVDYPLYPEIGIDEFKRLILRNCGNDFPYAHIRDILAHSLAKDEDLESMANRACMVFINGEYWGYQNLRERQDKFYLENHFDVEEVDLLESRHTAIQGDNDHWDDMVDFIAANDLTIPSNYEYVKTQMEVENFAIYNCYELFLGNTDWPDHNIKRWRPREEGGRWRWLFFDMDMSLNAGSGIPTYNMIDMATNPDESAYGTPYWSTVILNKLLKNAEFRQLFLAHYADRLNSVFLPVRMHAVMDSVQATIEPEIPRHRAHWEIGSSWSGRLAPIRDFIDERPDYTRGNFMEYFTIPDTVHLTLDIDPPGAGRIALTSVVVDSTWSGVYFEGIPIQLTAMPNEGWVFNSWSDPLLPENSQVTVLPDDDITLTAVFTEGESGQAVINEINYSAADNFDCGDWVEFYNRGDFPLEMGGWEFRDDSDAHVYDFPEEFVLESDEYLVLVRDRDDFLAHFPELDNLLPGEMDFGLGSEDMLRLYNDLDEIVDLVIYSDDPPWPPEPDGMGPTLELIDADSDNLAADAWAASLSEHGTPGQINSITEAVSVPDDVLPPELFLAHARPNPFNPSTELHFALPGTGYIELMIYDIKGRRLRTLHTGQLEAGEYRLSWDGRDDHGRFVSSGLYLARLMSANAVQTQKLMLLK
jgi:hypothetical protein